MITYLGNFGFWFCLWLLDGGCQSVLHPRVCRAIDHNRVVHRSVGTASTNLYCLKACSSCTVQRYQQRCNAMHWRV